MRDGGGPGIWQPQDEILKFQRCLDYFFLLNADANNTMQIVRGQGKTGKSGSYYLMALMSCK